MAFIDRYDFENLVDEGKKLVIEELGRQLENYPEEICKCNECVVDMATLALNNVLPCYRSSILGEIYTTALKDDPVYVERLRNVVKNAIIKVSRSPAHD